MYGPQALPLYYLSRNCTSLSNTDQLVLSQLSCAFTRGLGLPPLQCATWRAEWENDVNAVQRELYCGWADAGCGGGAQSSVGNISASGAVGVSSRRMLQQQPQPQPQQPAAVGMPSQGGPLTAGAVQEIEAPVERIVQYPSAVYDWRDSGPMGLNLAIWVNNSNVGVRTTEFCVCIL